MSITFNIYIDMSILFIGWFLAQILFNGYEAHLSWIKRITKFMTLFIFFQMIHYFAGRELFYSLLLLMSVGIGILHGYWFHLRHGIHWRTAEPREQYLRLIGKKNHKN